MDAALRVALIDDHPAILRALVAELGTMLDVAKAVTAAGVDEILASGEDFDLAILDVQLGDGSDPAENVRRLAERGLPVLLFTQETNARTVARCFQAGAGGIVGKDQELTDLVDAVRLLVAGQPYLSGDWAAALASDAGSIPSLAPREAEALRLYASGLPMKSVARRMAISPETVKDYLVRVRRRYSEIGRPAATKTELYIRAVEDSLVKAPESPT